MCIYNYCPKISMESQITVSRCIRSVSNASHSLQLARVLACSSPTKPETTRHSQALDQAQSSTLDSSSCIKPCALDKLSVCCCCCCSV